MALIVLLRGINVGGHRSFRPKLLAQELGVWDVVNIGAAGTLVVRKPGTRAELRAALRSRLPATMQLVLCEGRDLLSLAAKIPFHNPPPDAGIIRFVSFLASRARARPMLPLTIPQCDAWFVRVTTLTNRLAVGEYRRHMKTIGYLGQLDALFGTVVTTRSWNTVNAIVQILKDESGARRKTPSPPSLEFSADQDPHHKESSVHGAECARPAQAPDLDGRYAVPRQCNPPPSFNSPMILSAVTWPLSRSTF